MRWCLLCCIALGAIGSPHVGAAPEGGEIKAGAVAGGNAALNAKIAPTLNIEQQTRKLIIDWQRFNIGAQEAVVFRQPDAGSLALNRVIGGDPSAILGRLSANGQVFLINPHGVLFGAGAQVNVGALVASTLELPDADFLAGNYRFQQSAASKAVVNHGRLSAAPGGYVALFGKEVRNAGQISAPQGSVALGAGERVTLSLQDNQLVRFSVDAAAFGALVENHGLVEAEGGQVLLSAQAKDAMLRSVVNQTGIIEAKSLTERDGVIRLEGGGEGRVNAGGNLNVSAAAPRANGGSISVTSGDTLQVSGTLRADAGSAGGDGGSIETSAPAVDIAGANVSARATQGRNGRWLIDPTDVTINAAQAVTIAGTLNAGTNVTVQTVAAGAQPGNITVASSITKTVGATATLQLQAHNNIVFNTGVQVSSSSNALNVTLNADFDASGAGAILLNLNSAVLANGGDIVLGGGADPLLGAALGNGTLTSGVRLVGATLDAGGGDVFMRGGGLASGNPSRHGVSIETSGVVPSVVRTSGAGRIEIVGTAGGNSGAAATSGSHGVQITGANSRVVSGSGDISIQGAGGGITTGNNSTNHGVLVNSTDARIESAGGNISVDGTGGGGLAGDDSNNRGVYVIGTGARITTTGAGSINVVGIGGGGGGGNDDTNTGVEVSGTDARIAAEDGNITVSGTGGAGRSGNVGVTVTGGNARIETTGGAISVIGTGGGNGGALAASNNHGVQVNGAGARIIAAAGAIDVQGSGGGVTTGNNTTNYGVFVNNTDARIESGSGAISVIGIGGGGLDGDDSSNRGVYVTGSAARIVSSASGTVNVEGAGGGGGSGNDDTNNGVDINGADARIAAQDGDLTLRGTAGGTRNNNVGVSVAGTNARIEAVGGAVQVAGTGGANGSALATTGNHGVLLASTNSRIVTVSGAIDVQGVGGGTTAAANSNNAGVLLNTNDARIESTSGDISVTGTGGGGLNGDDGSNRGVYLNGARARITSGGTAMIDVSGTGGGGGSGSDDSNIGVHVSGTDARIAAQDGEVSVVGAGGNGRNTNTGVSVVGTNARIEAANGTINVTGTGGNGLDTNDGVSLSGSAARIANASGNINVNGTGQGGGNNNRGVVLSAAAQITNSAPSGGAIEILGVGAGSAAGVVTGTGANLIGSATHSGPITVTAHTSSGADSIQISATTNVRGSGDLVLQPRDAATAIGLTGAAGVFNLSAAELARVQDGFANVIIGRADGTGLIRHGGARTYLDDLTLRNPGSGSAGMQIAGVINMSGNNLTLNSAGTVTQSAAIIGNGLELLGAGAFALDNIGNSFTTLAASGIGSLSYFDSNALAIGAVKGSNGVAADGAVLLRSASGAGNDLSLNADVTSVSNDVTLASGEDIDYGSAALSAGGRWLTYSRSEQQDSGTLPAPGNAKPNIYNSSFAALGPGVVLPSGNHHIYLTQPQLSYVADAQSRLYGEPNTALTGGVVGLLSGDNALDAYFGTLAFATPATAVSNVGAYAIDGSGLSSDIGYAFVQAAGNASALTVTPRPLDISAADAARVYGDPNPGVTGFTTGPGGLVNGDAIASVTNTIVPSANAQAPAGSTHAIAPAAPVFASGSAGNYAISFIAGNLIITQRPLTVSADDKTRREATANPPFTATITGFAPGESLANLNGALVFSTPATLASPAGRYPIVASGVSSGNYSIMFIDGVLSVGSATAAGQDAALNSVLTSDGALYDCNSWYPLGHDDTLCVRRDPVTHPTANALNLLKLRGASPRKQSIVQVQQGGVRLPPGAQ